MDVIFFNVVWINTKLARFFLYFLHPLITVLFCF
jgi:hypothetical protein